MNNSKNNLGNNYLKIVISGVIFLISLVFILNNPVKTNISPIIEFSKQESVINYKVKIFENDFIPEDYMDKDKTYITDLVDNIDINYDYKLSNAKKIASECKYNITCKTTVNHNSTGKELWTDEIVLVDSKDLPVEKNDVVINESVTVDYDKINTKVKTFKEDFNIPIDAKLDINLNIIDTDSKKTIYSTGLNTSLNTEIINISQNDENALQNELSSETKTKISIPSVIAIIISLASLVYLVLEILKTAQYNLSRKSFYEKAVYKILKNYGDIVAELVSPVDLSKLNVIDVKNFDQMLDVEEELRIPIMFYETKKGREGEFVIVTNEIAYRYILKDKNR